MTFADDIDVEFAASDENLDLIVRELDLVTQFLERDEQNQSMQRSKAKNRERVNQAQQADTSESQSPSVAEKINQGTKNITKRKQQDMGNIINSKGDMEL